MLCDEFTEIALIRASLDGLRLATAPKFLLVLEAKGLLSTAEVEASLDAIRDVRNWGGNGYVERVRNRL